MLDAVELKRRSFSCLFSSGQHGGQRKPADVIINGMASRGEQKRRKLLQKSYMMAFYVHVDEGRGLLGRSV